MPSPPSAAFLLTGVGMMGVAVIAVWYGRGRLGASGAAFGLGVLGWTVGVALKFAWALPTNSLIDRALNRVLPASVAGPVFWVYIGLLTGIFECGIALPLAKRTRLRGAGWEEALGFGVGFGAVEAFLLGLLQFVGLLAAIAFWGQLPEEARTKIGESPMALGIGFIPLPVAERVSAVVAHVYCSVLIVYGVRLGQARWFWLSFVYKSALDAFAAACLHATPMMKSLAGFAAFEAAVGGFAIVGLVGLAFLRRRFRQLAASEPPHPAPGTSDAVDPENLRFIV